MNTINNVQHYSEDGLREDFFPIEDKDTDNVDGVADLLNDSGKINEISKSGPTSIKDLRWRHVDESPDITPHNPLVFVEEKRKTVGGVGPTTGIETPKHESSDSVKRIFREVKAFSSWGELRVNNWIDPPEEINLLAELLDAYSPAGYDVYDGIQAVVDVTFKRLRRVPMRESHQWTGVKQSIVNEGPITSLVNDLSRISGGFSRTHFDTAVISALACGEPMVAIQLIASAQTLLPSEESDSTLNALSRLVGEGGIFSKAYDLYSQDLKEYYDVVMSCIGEQNDGYQIYQGTSTPEIKPFGLKSLEGYIKGKELKTRSEEALRKRLHYQQDRWYAHQTIVPSDKRTAKYLSEDAVLAFSGDSGQSIEGYAGKAARDIVEGEVANVVAAELSRRLLTDLNIDNVLKGKKDAVLGKRSGGLEFYKTNLFTEIYRDLDESQKRKQVKEATFGHQDFSRNIISPDDVQSMHNIYRHFVLLLNDPIKYGYKYTLEMKNFQGYKEEKKLHAKRLLGALEFFETVTMNDKLRTIVEREFGFSSLSENTFNNARNTLEELFSNLVDVEDRNEGLDLSATLIGDELESKAEDSRTVEQLAALMDNEISTRGEENKTRILETITTMTTTLQEEIGRIEQESSTLFERRRLEDLVAATESRISTKKDALDKITEMPTKGLFSNRNAISSSEKDRQLQDVHNELSQLEETLKRTQTEIVEKGGFLNQTDLEELAELETQIGNKRNSLNILMSRLSS